MAPDAAIDEGAITGGKAVLKQDGQKADDAEVPVRLWDSMFLLSRPTVPGLSDKELPNNWRHGMDLFRRILVKTWRRRVLRSWVVWYQQILPTNSLHPIRSWFDLEHRQPGARIRRASDPNSAVQHQFNWHYRWTPCGLAAYKDWHKAQRENGRL